MSQTFDFGKLAFEVINEVTETMVRLHPEMIVAEDKDDLFQEDEYYELEASVSHILRHAGDSQGQWCMSFLTRQDIVDVFQQEHDCDYDLTKEEEREVVRFFGKALESNNDNWTEMLADAIETVSTLSVARRLEEREDDE